MKRMIPTTLLLLLFATAAAAQSSAVGLMLGVTDALDGGWSPDLDFEVAEIFYSTRIDLGAELRLQLGRVETDSSGFRLDPSLPDEATVEYAGIWVEYRFWESWGSSSMFLGPGAYRVEQGGLSESDFGIAGGVGALFPLTRRTSVTAEAAYHWVNLEGELDFINVNVGLRFSF